MADPLDDLRRAWQATEAPPVPRELAEEDELTRAAVAWMSQAWHALAPPPAALVLLHARRRRRRNLLRAGLGAFAVAAGLLVAALSPVPSPPRSDQPSLPTAATPPPQPAPHPAPQLLLTAGDRVVLRAGSVRLTLLRDPAASPSPAASTHEAR